MKQLSLNFPPASSLSNSGTSRQAEKKITKSGQRKNHCQIIYHCLREHNGSTTKELAEYLDGILTYPQIWRRMADLLNNDLVTQNKHIVRDGCSTWWINL